MALSFEVTMLLGAGDMGISNDGFCFLLLGGADGVGVEPKLVLDVPQSGRASCCAQKAEQSQCGLIWPNA